MIAFKPFYAAPVEQRPAGVPLDAPWMVTHIAVMDALQYQKQGFVVLTQEEYDQHVANMADRMAEWESIRTQLQVEQTLQAAMNFGTQCLREFSAQNVLMGITQAGMTGAVLTILTGVMQALLAGSLYEAMDRIREIDPANYDGAYLNATRCLAFVNKIEAYLGLPLSESL